MVQQKVEICGVNTAKLPLLKPSSNENVDDLFQIGCIGLMKAIDNFGITLNVKFSTYAVPMIIS